MNFKTIDRAADNIRILSAAMVEKAKSGHPGGAMGGADFINILYSEFLNWDPDDMSWPNRDRFYLDPGHMSPMLYSVLTLTGAFSIDDIKDFRQWGSSTPGHPERDIKRGVENTSGPLGQGHAMGLGAAIAERFLAARFGEWMAHKTYAYVSDGGIQEEISQGVGRMAGHLGLSNFVMFFDSNAIQLSSTTSEVTSEDTEAKYKSWGWNVLTIDGNDQHQIRQALRTAQDETEKPTLIIGNTVMGKGARDSEGNSFEHMVSTHGMPLTGAGASIEATIKNLGGDPRDPFAVFPDVKEYYEDVLNKKRQYAKQKKAEQAQWEEQNPQLAKKFWSFMDGELPKINWEEIVQKQDIPSRAASGVVLGEFGKKVENMIVSSADLSNSDKTDGFLKQQKILQKGDFTGGFLQAGVAELTMAAVMNGIASHGGVLAVCGTFFAFSDYMKPAIRMAALMELPVKYIWTHDAFRVGEDGPTHQPIEQEAQVRLLEKMANLKGKRSMLVLRPADAVETTVAWKIAYENIATPSALLLSRQKIKDVPAQENSTRYKDALGARKGAYIVRDCDGTPDVVLVANGSEVITLVEGASVLSSKMGLKVRVVSAPSESLFFEQSEEYRDSIIPFGVPALGLTAGLPVALKDLVGPMGKVIGMERFGASAPFTVLDEKFGYTASNVVKQVETYLAEHAALLEKIASLTVTNRA
ncbi:transketolase [Chitinispirillales bacterium ANBcel5]|uniref:transketolase family protein n=1 Tax=Cellulosispirillum alkaliphilum TaxID=3039283 RepID=UPI002A5016C7|nr:transketolase [Chitinispirillales bacterium ANBcel5]